MTELDESTNLENAWAEHATRLAAMTFPDALGPGDRAPAFELPSAHGARLRLSSFLERGPVVLVFYRGGWCPWCNTQLRGLQAALDRIAALGGSLVAVSPQTPPSTAAFIDEARLGFEVLSDVNSFVASDYGITFELAEADRRLFRSVGNDLAAVNGSDAWILPAPSTFVIAQDAIIEYARIDPNYTSRPDVEEVLAVLAAVASA
jgi:peroxiredoxin